MRLTLCNPMDCSTPHFPVLQSSPRVYSNSCSLCQWCHPTISSSAVLFSFCLQSFQASFLRFFSSESALHIRWTKYWSFSFSISPSDEYSGLISFRIDWFDILAVQGTIRSLLQHHNLKALILQHSALFMVQQPHLYMPTGKTTALTTQIFVSIVMSLLLKTLPRFVIAFLSRSKYLLTLWLQSLSAVILEPKKINCHCFPIYLPWNDGTRCHDLSFLNAEF